jgi:hypothetical protein
MLVNIEPKNWNSSTDILPDQGSIEQRLDAVEGHCLVTKNKPPAYACDRNCANGRSLQRHKGRSEDMREDRFRQTNRISKAIA